LIAQEPLPERDSSRLLRVPGLSHHEFRDLPRLLNPGDLLVVNNSRVFPARLFGKTGRGASVELLLLRPLELGHWEVLARPARRLDRGTRIELGGGSIHAKVIGCLGYGKRTVAFFSEGDFFEMIEKNGQTPLPPYIQRAGTELEARDRERYQTVYARERGSVAAPTAGLHFTPRVLRVLSERGVGVAEVTLHVGYGTFQPMRTDSVEEHQMDSERFTIPTETVQALERTRARGGKVIAVGTTTVRTLESAADERGAVTAGSSETDLFIYPGFRFRVVDALLTNFHLPKSSLFLLVSAFGGKDVMRGAYQEAIRERYRFYSYGDCMLIY
jgi:S-adenosylmethionine:tRNA ribosyltransferase-isomerase